MELTRRTLLGAGLTGAAASLAGLPSLSSALSPRFLPKGPVKNVIFCVSDGMPIQILSTVNHIRMASESKPSYWAWLMEQEGVFNGLQDAKSLNTVVTDSAAAGSAWGCGRKIWNGQINEFPDGTKLKTLTQILKPMGVACGLVTTATVTHATPAAFAANVPQRSLEHLIAEQYLEQQIDIVMGGGHPSFDASSRPDGMDLYGKFREEGYGVVRTRAEMLATEESKMLGIFSNSHLPYTIDQKHDSDLQTSVPTLAEMTQVALAKLGQSSEGFLLQVEGARIDHAGHGNDIGGMIFDQIAFEDAVEQCISYAMRDGETLVIVTSDHGCGGFSLNGAGSGYGMSTQLMNSIMNMKGSFTQVLSRLDGESSTAVISDVIKDKLEIEATAEEAQALKDAFAGESPFRTSSFFRSPSATLGMIVGNHTAATFTSGNHTSEHMLVTAYGPGAEAFAGFYQNNHIFDLILAAKGTSHENPRMTFEEAAAHREARQIDPELIAKYSVPDDDHEGYLSPRNSRQAVL